MARRARADGKLESSVRNQLVQVGCWLCDAICPLTDDTEPRLTEELGEQWLQQHKYECPVRMQVVSGEIDA